MSSGQSDTRTELTLNPSLEKRGTFAPLIRSENVWGTRKGKTNVNRSTRGAAKTLCRDLRRRSTRSEQLFWRSVRDRKVLGKKFLRQFPIFFEYMGKEAFFIADFYCHENRLVVEIDGKNHDYQREHDELRTYVINNLGIEVIRFPNEEIETDIDKVLEELKAVLMQETHPESLS